MIRMKGLLERLKEPSTYAGIATCLAGFGLLGLTRAEWDQILGALVALIGAAAIFLKERPRAADDRGTDDARRNRPEGARCLTCGRPSARARIRD
jgi:hypothetical protein